MFSLSNERMTTTKYLLMTVK